MHPILFLLLNLALFSTESTSLSVHVVRDVFVIVWTLSFGFDKRSIKLEVVLQLAGLVGYLRIG